MSSPWRIGVHFGAGELRGRARFGGRRLRRNSCRSGALWESHDENSEMRRIVHASCYGDASSQRNAPCARAKKEELGLDHFEGGSWTGLHRHALMTMIAYAFLQSRRLKAAGRKKRAGGPPPQPSMPAIRQAILNLFAQPPPRRCPHCEKPLADPGKQKLPK
jgi:hypothetical protein